VARTLRERLRDYALTLPGAFEDDPWGEVVAKVGKKVFVFLGVEETPGLTVKLADSHAQALMLSNASPTGYGLGRSGWVTIELHGKLPPFGVLTDFIDESYGLVAPKKLSAELDASRGRSRVKNTGGSGAARR
jgi:predicted DNA-binding protein (MmcQ/YjbR family)